MQSLVIVERTVWQLHVDVLVIECAGGNLMDAIVLATRVCNLI